MDPYDRPFRSPKSSPNNPFPHSLLRTREKTSGAAARRHGAQQQGARGRLAVEHRRVEGLPLVFIVVPFFGLTNFFVKDPRR